MANFNRTPASKIMDDYKLSHNYQAFQRSRRELDSTEEIALGNLAKLKKAMKRAQGVLKSIRTIETEFPLQWLRQGKEAGWDAEYGEEDVTYGSDGNKSPVDLLNKALPRFSVGSSSVWPSSPNTGHNSSEAPLIQYSTGTQSALMDVDVEGAGSGAFSDNEKSPESTPFKQLSQGIARTVPNASSASSQGSVLSKVTLKSIPMEIDEEQSQYVCIKNLPTQPEVEPFERNRSDSTQPSTESSDGNSSDEVSLSSASSRAPSPEILLDTSSQRSPEAKNNNLAPMISNLSQPTRSDAHLSDEGSTSSASSREPSPDAETSWQRIRVGSDASQQSSGRSSTDSSNESSSSNAFREPSPDAMIKAPLQHSADGKIDKPILSNPSQQTRFDSTHLTTKSSDGSSADSSDEGSSSSESSRESLPEDVVNKTSQRFLKIKNDSWPQQSTQSPSGPSSGAISQSTKPDALLGATRESSVEKIRPPNDSGTSDSSENSSEKSADSDDSSTDSP